ncbi:hypothetical protein [Legionella longbeachae]|uniref:Uncharacterized protein n=1 Tax=Legionella longbeachae serogroup 1 (strain NSW150) TaxID=661367 RepID=D3HTL3_LEGLN|nr:hypothetical protein [Legionella longbeachae]QIN35874.1 hypothetical protein GCS73_09650 [Legionella longbeachae]CBJ12255.1 hypothetical protein LLO_1877 [Legionella longbeachae NSW150]
MKIRGISNKFLGVNFLLWLIYSNSISGTSNCLFDLPPGEQFLIQGNFKFTRKFECNLISKEQNTNNLLSFNAIKNKSIINNLAMPEGTVMVLFTVDNFKDGFSFELEPESSLGITNDSEEFVSLNCCDKVSVKQKNIRYQEMKN